MNKKGFVNTTNIGDIMFKKSLISRLFAVLFVLSFFSISSFAEDIKIASIDTSKILMAHPAFQKAMEKYQAELKTIQEKIKEMDENEQATAQYAMQCQMQELGMQLESEAFSEMRKDVKLMAEKRGFKFVIDTNVLIVGGHDITEYVLSELSKKEEKSPAKKK